MQYLLIITLVLLTSLQSLAQSLNGKVTDRQGKGIAGAHVLHVKTGDHVHTDDKGVFVISMVAIGDTIRISHLGFETASLLVQNLDGKLRISLTEKTISLNEVKITSKLDAINLFADINLQTNPVNSSQDLLRKVPGLVIGQHAGGGKAEQIFLRGFDIDHGTDINITVDGMPVNMVSHAHGQGYADLHFVIPETLEGIEFGKGPYYADQGNFATAGFVNFRTKDKLKNSMLKLEAGQFNTQRLLGMFNLLGDHPDHSAYVASEYLLTDGPFESEQNFNRLNLMAKYSGTLLNQDQISTSISYFTSTWDASGQVPERAIENGLISRFGAIDAREGGNTSRANILVDYKKNLNEKTFIKNTAYFSQYDFELYSNFTFFLEDSINGDQIRQKESRKIFGLKSELNLQENVGFAEGFFQLSVGIRNDQSEGNELSHTKNRVRTLENIQLGDINETNLFLSANSIFEAGKWSINPGFRIDQFNFSYYDRLLPEYKTQSESKAIFSPKLNILYNYSSDLQIYLKTGKGFHSNDTRVVVAQEGRQILPAAYGADLGLIWKPFPELLINSTYWHLYLEQEFVYVGDAGVVEPGGETKRQGVELNLRHQPFKWLFWDLDANYTIARAMEETEGNGYIPLAPDLTIIGGVNIISPTGFYGGMRVRFVDDRPANEDNSIVAKGYTVVDLNSGYQWRNFDLGISIQNLFDTEWNEAQFATESRLSHETAPVEEIHFTPGMPFFLKGVLSYKF